MSRLCFKYLLTVLFIVLIGILSRSIKYIPFFVGDILYATMIYFIIRFIIPKSKYTLVLLIALLLCFTIEFQQTITSEWLVNLRKTLLGRYILGQGFLWSDLVYYSLGIYLGYLIDTLLIKNHKA